MSIDYTAYCKTHNHYHHLGQCMAGLTSFGWGSNDVEGRARCGLFVECHVNNGCDVRIIQTDDIPEDAICIEDTKQYDPWDTEDGNRQDEEFAIEIALKRDKEKPAEKS